MKRPILLLGCALLLIGFGCAPKTPSSDDGTPVIDREAILLDAKKNGLIMNEQEKVKMADPAVLKTVKGTHPSDITAYLSKDFAGWKSAALADVTAGGSFGLAFTKTEQGMLTLVVKMGNLPELQNGYVYEGWLVRRGEQMSVVNVGVAQQVGGQYGIVLTTAEDLSDHDFFVVTLEPDQTDTIPAEHILEGRLE